MSDQATIAIELLKGRLTIIERDLRDLHKRRRNTKELLERALNEQSPERNEE